MLLRSIMAGHLLQVVVRLSCSAHYIFFVDVSHSLLLPSYALLLPSHALLLPSHALLLFLRMLLPFMLCCFLLSRLHCRDNLAVQGKESKVSAAVVFLPRNTLHYGKCGRDKCYCVEVGISSLLSFRHLFNQPRPIAPLASPSCFMLLSWFLPFRCTARRRNGAACGSSSGASTS
jgi:hypothetical protein